jgi:hypothetical protein
VALSCYLLKMELGGTSDMSLVNPHQLCAGQLVLLDLAWSSLIILAALWLSSQTNQQEHEFAMH